MAFSNHDLVFDSPTNNFATWNQSDEYASTLNLSEGNLRVYSDQATWWDAYTTISMSQSGKYYCEMYALSDAIQHCFGVCTTSAIDNLGASNGGVTYHTNFSSGASYFYGGGGNRVSNVNGAQTTVSSGTLLSASTNDIVGILLDLDNDTVKFYIDNSLVGTTSSIISGNYVFFYNYQMNANQSGVVANFGQDPTFGGAKVPTKVYTDANGIGRFFHEPPTGALALCTANLAAATTAPTEYIVDETNQHLLTYNGNVTQSKFTPYATDGYSLDGMSTGINIGVPSNLISGTGDWSFESWVYLEKHQNFNSLFSTRSANDYSGGDCTIGSNGTIAVVIDYNGSSGWDFGQTSSNTVPLNKWVHICIERYSGDCNVYIDGVKETIGSFGANSLFASTFKIGRTEAPGNQNFKGHMSDIRIKTGGSFYNGTVTVPNAPLSSTDSSLHISSNSKQIIDSSTNSYSLTLIASPLISDWSPYTPEAVRTGYEYRNPDEHGGGSFYFDGSGDYLTIPGSADTAFGTGAFTIEFWLYVTNLSANTYHCLMDFRDSSTSGNDTDAFGFFIHGSAATAGNIYIFQGTSISFNQVLKGNQWNHIALVRTGTGSNELSLYLNGVNGTNQTLTTDLSATNTVHIGKYPVNSSFDLYGYMTDIRIIKGVAAYTGNFTPPISKLSTSQSSGTGKATVSTSDTKFLLQPYKSKITKDILNYGSDETGKALTYVGNASVVNTSPYKDGVLGGFNFYNSSSSHDYLKLSSSNAWTPGANSPFTIEFWYKTSVSISTNNPIMTTAGWSSNFLNRWQIQTNSDKIAFSRSDGNGNLFVGATVLATNKWYHVAIVQDSSSVWKMYLNGIQDATGTDSGFTTDSYLEIGANSTLPGGNGVRGQISDIRIVKGQALYTANFIPPAYPLLSNTYTIDGSDPASGTTITGTVLLAQPGRFIENTAEADNTDNFKAVTYTGQTVGDAMTAWDGTTGTVNVGFQPDLVWFKARTAANYHALVDSVRGSTKVLTSNEPDAEDTVNSGNGVVFNANGFTVDPSPDWNSLNSSGTNIVAWCWKAGGTPTGGFTGTEAMVDGVETTCSALTTSAGASITPTAMSVNTDAGFSIVKFNGVNSTGTLPHGLSQEPDFVIFKKTSATSNWIVHRNGYAARKFLYLNNTNGLSDAGADMVTSYSNSVLSLGTDGDVNPSDGASMIVYCWHSVEGYSKFGSYEGSTALPFVYCGFRPSLLILKNADDSTSWVIHDSARDVYNEVENVLVANGSSNETTYATTGVDFLSNGFKLRGDSSWYGNNLSTTQTVIYMAFAEQPFIYSNAR